MSRQSTTSPLCRHCRHAQGRWDVLRQAPRLWCLAFQKWAITACEKYEREPGSDDEMEKVNAT